VASERSRRRGPRVLEASAPSPRFVAPGIFLLPPVVLSLFAKQTGTAVVTRAEQTGFIHLAAAEWRRARRMPLPMVPA
jgi:hypothetical protein